MGGAPLQRGIQGLHPRVFSKFFGGRVTNVNLTNMPDEVSLIANDILFLADDCITPRGGYALIKKPTAAQVLSLFDFQRSSDNAQFLISQHADGTLWSMDVLGQQVPNQLSATQDLLAKFRYAPADAFLYMSNGKASLRLVDNAGNLALYKWGIAGPPTPPTVALSGGTLTLTYGRQYVYCYVSKITDSRGIQRISIGPPSPISAHTGPFTSDVVTVGALQASTDPQVTHIWVFATYDTPFNTTSIFNFAGEIANGVTSFGDTLPDAQLDFTRTAPFDNNPAPLAAKVMEFQSRYVAIGLAGEPDQVSFSGFEEISIGQPPEAWPADLTFKIPGGSQAVTGGEVYGEGVNSQLLLATKSYWWSVTGWDLASFSKRDRIVTPGCAGLDATCVTSRFIMWVAPDKNIYAWDTQSKPLNVSAWLSKPLLGSMSMADISDAALVTSKLVRVNFGQYFFILHLCATNAAAPNTYDWIQVWDASQLEKQWPNIPTLSDGSTTLLAESDFWPSDIMAAATVVTVNGHDYVYMGDTVGNIYQWPNGTTDNGKKFVPVWGSAWTPGLVFIGQMFHPTPPQDVTKRFMFADLTSNERQDTAQAFRLLGVACETPDMNLPLIDCGLMPKRSQKNPPSGLVATANLTKPGMASGKWARFVIVFPNDGQPATISRLALSCAPLYGIRP